MSKGAAVTLAKREFKFDKIILPDPDPDMSAEEVKIFYSNQYPDLINSKTEEATKDGKQTFKFQKQTRTLG